MTRLFGNAFVGMRMVTCIFLVAVSSMMLSCERRHLAVIESPRLEDLTICKVAVGGSYTAAQSGRGPGTLARPGVHKYSDGLVIDEYNGTIDRLEGTTLERKSRSILTKGSTKSDVIKELGDPSSMGKGAEWQMHYANARYDLFIEISPNETVTRLMLRKARAN